MIIPINLHPERSSSSTSTCTFPPAFAQFGSDELVLIELQGSLEVEGDNLGQMVGKLNVETSTKKSTLLIGHHLLEGKLVNLPKPLAVLHRSSQAEDANNTGTDPVFVDDESKKSSKSWDVVAVVKKKMVFAKRPMPMVGRASGIINSGGRKVS